MSLIEAVALALLQGLTEFLPVSSSGHLVLAQSLFGHLSEGALTYILILHLATMTAVLAFYHREIAGILRGLFPPYRSAPLPLRNSRRLLLLMAIASLPTAFVGWGLREFFEGLFLTPDTVAAGLFFTGLLLFAASLLPPRDGSLAHTPWRTAFLVGLAQAAAIMPGISRSGATISAGLFLGLRRDEAARLSFLLLVPATVGAALLESGRFASLGKGDLIHYALGFIVAAAVGYLAILMVIRWVNTGRLWHFAAYCWFVAAAAALAGWVGN